MSKIIFITISLILLSHLATSARIKNTEPYMRFTSTNCHSSNKSVSGYKCYIKANSQRNTTLNVFVNLSRPLFYVKFSYDLNYKTVSNSQRSIINVTFEACSMLNGTAANPVFNWVMSNMPDLQKAVHACPYKVSWVQILGEDFNVFLKCDARDQILIYLGEDFDIFGGRL